MAQSITPELTALLKSTLQAGTSGFRGELEVDWVFPGYTDLGPLQNLALAIGTATGYTNGIGGVPAPINPGRINDGSTAVSSESSNGLALGGPFTAHRGWEVDLSAPCEVSYLQIAPHSGLHGPDTLEYSDDGVSWTAVGYTATANSPTLGWTRWDVTGAPVLAQHWRVTDSQFFAGPGFTYFEAFACSELQIFGSPVEAHDAEIRTTVLPVASLDLDRSRKMAAAQLDALLSNEAGEVGYYTVGEALIVPNNPCRAYAWLGDEANRVQVFTGLLDRVHESRDPREVSIKARSRLKWLIEQFFETTASQAATDEDAVRTEDNGVYLNRSPEYIAGDILDRAGWPSADRDIAVSGMVISEYDLADQTSWAEQIAGSNRLGTITGWDLWEDELGVVHFKANRLADTSEPDPDYTLEVAVDVLQLDHEVDDEERATRVRVSGPMTSAVPAWSEEWATTALLHPVGTLYRPSEPGYLYVIDRVTQYLSKLRQSDRAVVAHWYLGASLTNQPIGLSGDPTDSAHFYVLDAHLPGSGTYTNCKVRKYAFSAPATLVATTTLADGQWSDLKFDGTHLWLTNYGDDKLYEKTFNAGGAAGATASYTYAGHTNPTGLYLDGTTIGLFFNGGTAFYLVDTGAPGTILSTQSTAGTRILGGEADTTTHADLYATNEAGDFGATAGHVWKFQLTEEVTNDVTELAADQDLEDELGFQSGIADRVHDLHPLDAAHPFEMRLAVYPMLVVTSTAQALAVAEAQLALLSRLRRVLDLATLGEPHLQVDDVIRYIDPVAGIDSVWVLDSYRAQLGADTYTTSMSLLPWEAPE